MSEDIGEFTDSAGEPKKSKPKKGGLPQRVPEDKTSEISPPERRLDTFARLLAAESECVAVAIINGELVAAANEIHGWSEEDGFGVFHPSHDSNENIKAIKKIAQYFQFVVERKRSSVEEAGVQDEQGRRKAIFQSVFSVHRLSFLIGKSGLPIPHSLPSEVLAVILDEDKRKNLYEVLRGRLKEDKSDDKTKSSGHLAAFGLACGEYIRIQRDVEKLEDSIKNFTPGGHVGSSGGSSSSSSSSSVDTEEEKLTQLQFDAIGKKIKILKLPVAAKTNESKHEKPRVPHAEMQMLSDIITKLADKSLKTPVDIYIGISKLCCLACGEVLKAAQNVLLKHGVRLEFRGTHNLDFPRSWVPPLLFTDGSNKTAAEIWKEAEAKIGKLRTTTRSPSGVSQSPRLSDSDVEPQPGLEALERQVAELKSHQEIFQKYIGNDISAVMAKIDGAIKAGASLISFEAFTQFEKREQIKLLKKLEKRLEFLQNISSTLGSSGNIEKILNLISISLELHGLESFQILSETLPEPVQAGQVLATIITEYEKKHKGKTVKKEDVHFVLSSPLLVSENVSNYFKGFSLRAKGLHPSTPNPSSSSSSSSSSLQAGFDTPGIGAFAHIKGQHSLGPPEREAGQKSKRSEEEEDSSKGQKKPKH